MAEKRRKGMPPPRYDDAFKAGAVRMVTEQKRPLQEVAQELGVCIDTLKTWLRRAGHGTSAPPLAGNHSRVRELEAEVKALKKTLAEKEETIDVLKKSVGIFSKP
jgi:transposase